MTATAAVPPHLRSGRLDVVQLFFNGAGRIGRRLFAAALVPLCLTARLAMATEGGLSWALWGLALVTTCTVLSKRLHDLSLAGWWAAGPVGLLAVVLTGDAPTNAAQTTALALAAGLVLALALWPGERRFNRFGPAPGERQP